MILLKVFTPRLKNARHVLGCDYRLALKMADEGQICKVDDEASSTINGMYNAVGLGLKVKSVIGGFWPRYKFYI